MKDFLNLKAQSFSKKDKERLAEQIIQLNAEIQKKSAFLTLLNQKYLKILNLQSKSRDS